MKYFIDIVELTKLFRETRKRSERICHPLHIEDYGPQPAEFVSPPKWHLAHTSWFFEQFVLLKYDASYREFHPEFSFLFNSYYNNIGDRLKRNSRGLMSRPLVIEVYDFRAHVNKGMEHFLKKSPQQEVLKLIELGINHEEQHQELLIYDIKYILGKQIIKPIYGELFMPEKEVGNLKWLDFEGGVFNAGAKGNQFCFDNELPSHKVFIEEFKLSSRLVSNGEYLEFIDDGAYKNFNLWHADGWDFIKTHKLNAPLYWEKRDGVWFEYHLNGMKPLDIDLPVSHLSFYEAYAFSQWKNCRLPTEFEWELAAGKLNKGNLWEWTSSAHLPYPAYKKASGAVGEYNSKFMMNQMVLRGGSAVTPPGHCRDTYRNFFHPQERWMYSGIRLAK